MRARAVRRPLRVRRSVAARRRPLDRGARSAPSRARRRVRDRRGHGGHVRRGRRARHAPRRIDSARAAPARGRARPQHERHRRDARRPARAPSGLDLLGKSTDAAVGNGAMLALTGALERAVARRRGLARASARRCTSRAATRTCCALGWKPRSICGETWCSKGSRCSRTLRRARTYSRKARMRNLFFLLVLANLGVRRVAQLVCAAAASRAHERRGSAEAHARERGAA